MRFGTRTELGRRWTACGIGPSGEQIIGYEYGYLSVALNPRTGELFALLLPDMTVESFQAFVDEFCRFVGKKNACSPDNGRGGSASQHAVEDGEKTDD